MKVSIFIFKKIRKSEPSFSVRLAGRTDGRRHVKKKTFTFRNAVFPVLYSQKYIYEVRNSQFAKHDAVTRSSEQPTEEHGQPQHGQSSPTAHVDNTPK